MAGQVMVVENVKDSEHTDYDQSDSLDIIEQQFTRVPKLIS